MSNEEEVALKQFDTITRYYAFETTMYWTRSHFFLVANAGLLVFTASRLLETDLDHPYLLIIGCIFGCVLSIFWLKILKAGLYWTDRWENICELLEPKAMGKIEVFRNSRRPESRSRESAQDDKWNFCLTAGTLCPANQERP